MASAAPAAVCPSAQSDQYPQTQRHIPGQQTFDDLAFPSQPEPHPQRGLQTTQNSDQSPQIQQYRPTPPTAIMPQSSGEPQRIQSMHLPQISPQQSPIPPSSIPLNQSLSQLQSAQSQEQNSPLQPSSSSGTVQSPHNAHGQYGLAGEKPVAEAQSTLQQSDLQRHVVELPGVSTPRTSANISPRTVASFKAESLGSVSTLSRTNSNISHQSLSSIAPPDARASTQSLNTKHASNVSVSNLLWAQEINNYPCCRICTHCRSGEFVREQDPTSFCLKV